MFRTNFAQQKIWNYCYYNRLWRFGPICHNLLNYQTTKRMKDILAHTKIPSLLNIIITTPQFVNGLYCIMHAIRVFLFEILKSACLIVPVIW